MSWPAQSIDTIYSIGTNIEATPYFDRNKLKEEQRKDTHVTTIIKRIEQKKKNEDAEKYFLDGDGIGLLYKEKDAQHRLERLMAPHSMANQILNAYHNTPFGGHQSTERTYAKIRLRFFWSNMYTHIKNSAKNAYPVH